MLKKWLLYGTSFCAIEHSTDKNNTDFYTGLQLSKKKKELNVTNRHQYNSINEVISFVKANKHAFLIINNQHVLSKKITVVNDSQKKLIQVAFPNIVISDFYYEIYSNDTESFISICRKEHIDYVIDLYSKNGISIVDFSLGNLALQNILPFIGNDNFNTSNAKITVENNKITIIEKEFVEDQTYIVNDLEVSNHELLPLGGVLSYYFDQNIEQIGLTQKTEELKKTYQQKKLFDLGLKFGFGFLFTILLINFLVFSHYTTKADQLTIDVQLNEQTKNRLISLQEKVAQKEKVVKNLQSVSQSKVSRHIDEIAQLIPNTILLTNIYYQPIKSRVKKGKTILVTKNQITVKGVSKKNEDSTHLISLLESKKWVDKVTIMSYGKQKNNMEFELLIHINNE
ncbi:hypothetical protein SAMN04487765_1295 [Tenacibaculum sp. MAR_2010_89]|uniref:PilN domain-containing protein n=1 Tax=Tenacibaculum sp. MAR_2010_89 TaxID=1250198 RepID=UPI00089D0677|nr:PilN domain-containing protein [Tenacibaculum sp. MAR_2010_89]SEE07163.1 hypothetical protein SAMN04487765_1295 [Tenacibaculum sp. MAR_2010_89]